MSSHTDRTMAEAVQSHSTLQHYSNNCLDLLTYSMRVLKKLTSSQLVKKFATLYGTGEFITSLQEPATCPYPEPDQSGPCPLIPLPEDPS
jgi:hypothetical protein